MMHVQSFEVTYPPIFKCFKASGGVILGLRFRVQGYMGVPTKIGCFFFNFEVTYPPMYEGSEANGAIKFT